MPIYNRECEVCGQPMTANRRTKRTCSDACRQSLHRQNLQAELETLRKNQKKQKPKADNAAGNLWFTPNLHLFLARMVLGGIDLDPASCEAANKNVKAARYFTEQDDGLVQDWTARTLWMNPPFTPHSLLAAFARKFLAEWQAGKIGAAIIVVDAAVDAGYCHMLAEQAAAICTVRGRIAWINGETGIAMGKDGTNGPKRGQVFYYFGPNVDRFAEAFEIVGNVSRPVRQLAEAA